MSKLWSVFVGEEYERIVIRNVNKYQNEFGALRFVNPTTNKESLIGPAMPWYLEEQSEVIDIDARD
jgi:hypothetical protein